MNILRTVAATALAMLVSACFMSETSFVPAGEGVALAEGQLRMCDVDGQCSLATPVDDGYSIDPPDGEEGDPVLARFLPLEATELGKVWLAEINMTDEGGDAFMLGLVRQLPDDGGGLPVFQFALADCADASDELLETYAVPRLDQWTCGLPASGTLGAFLIDVYGDKLGDANWWNNTLEEAEQE